MLAVAVVFLLTVVADVPLATTFALSAIALLLMTVMTVAILLFTFVMAAVVLLTMAALLVAIAFAMVRTLPMAVRFRVRPMAGAKMTSV